MPFIAQSKTNWLFIIIVAVLAIFIGIEIFIMLNNLNSDLTLVLFPPEIKKLENIQNEAAGWKTYQNKEYGYSFQYPAEYDNIQDCGIHLGTRGELQMDQIMIDVLDVDKFTYYTRELLKQYTSESILIDNKEAIKVDYLWGGNKDSFVFLIYKNNFYRISLYGGTSCLVFQKRTDAPSNQEVYERILTTFKFYEPKKEFITVVSPNGGENLKIGEKFKITWKSRGVGDYVKIYLDEKINNNRIEIADVPNTGSFDWTVDQVFDDEYKLVVEGILREDNIKKIEDESNDYFYITPSLVTSTYFYWTEDNIEYTFRKASLGNINVPYPITKDSQNDYKAGDSVYALTLTFWMNISRDFNEECVPMNFSRVLDEKGNTVTANTKYFVFLDTGGCKGASSQTHTDQKVIFVVLESQKTFTILTGGKSNMTFNIKVENGQLKVEQECITESCGKVPSKKPDLIIKNVVLSPQYPKIGDNLKFTVTVKNIGTEFSPETYVRAAILSGTWGNTSYIPILLPGEEKTVTLADIYTYQIKELKNPYIFEISVDITDRIKELNEINNKQTKTFNISLP